MPSTPLARKSYVRHTDAVPRERTGKKPYTAKMTPAVRDALDAFAKSIGSNRSDVIEQLVRERLGLPTVGTPHPKPAEKRKGAK